jgi:hypothetical protein
MAIFCSPQLRMKSSLLFNFLSYLVFSSCRELANHVKEIEFHVFIISKPEKEAILAGTLILEENVYLFECGGSSIQSD